VNVTWHKAMEIAELQQRIQHAFPDHLKLHPHPAYNEHVLASARRLYAKWSRCMLKMALLP